MNLTETLTIKLSIELDNTFRVGTIHYKLIAPSHFKWTKNIFLVLLSIVYFGW
jgi:hypothetical protein